MTRNELTRNRTTSREDAMLKAELHRQANSQLSASIENENWLAAIAIEESLISDRIESYFAKHHDIHKLNSLEQNLRNMERKANLHKDGDLRLLKHLKEWKDQRNIAIHEIVKVREGEMLEWEARLSAAKSAALMGHRLAAQVNNWSRRNP